MASSYLFSEQNNYLILSTENSIKYINVFNQDIVSEYQIKLPKTEEMNNTLNIKTVPFSDDLVILSGFYKFIYTRFDNDYKTINSVEKNYEHSLVVTWKLIGSLLCFLLESKKGNNEFLINKISVDNDSIEIKEIFKEKLELSSLKSFCVTQNFDYLVFYKTNRVLNVYRIIDGTCIATVPMFSEIIVLRATSQFIIMALDEKRIISYLIADPKSSDSSYKIKSLDSR